MTFSGALATIFEIGMAIALLWCFFHEDRLIAFEKRLLSSIRRRRLKVIHTAYSNPHTIRQ